MKWLGNKPPVPPYLHLGSVRVPVPARQACSSTYARRIDAEWRIFSTQIIRSPIYLQAVFSRIDQRLADPNYFEEPYDVLYTVADLGYDQSIIDFYF